MNLSSYLRLIVLGLFAVCLPRHSLQAQSKGIDPTEEAWVDDLGRKVPGSEEFIDYDVEAKAINLDQIKNQIVYPSLAEEAGIDGKSIFRILVAPSGATQKVLCIRHQALVSDSIKKHLKGLKWIPAHKNGAKVYSWVTLPFIICYRK